MVSSKNRHKVLEEIESLQNNTTAIDIAQDINLEEARIQNKILIEKNRILPITIESISLTENQTKENCKIVLMIIEVKQKYQVDRS